MMQLGMSPMSSPEKNMRRGTKKGSFIGGSFINGGFAEANESEEQKKEREKKELIESFEVMDKD